MTQYAVADSSGKVLRLCLDSDPGVGDGEVAIELASPVDGWPQADHDGAALMVDEYGALSWADGRTLADAQAQAWERVKADRAARELAAGEVIDPAWDSDPASQARITSVAVALLANPGIATVDFTCKDNARRTYTRAEFLTAALTISAEVQALFETADELRGDIEAAATVAVADAVVWP